MESLSGLGDGVAVAAADLDLRGAGDLFGDKQAGHVRALGTGLYQHLLSAAVAQRLVDPAPASSPDLHTGITGQIPRSYIPEQDLRLSLYARLARLPDAAALLAFAEELEDRFGPRPPELDHLLELHSLGLACIRLGVKRLDAGPRGAALTVDAAGQPQALGSLAKAFGGSVRDGRLLLDIATADSAKRMARLIEILAKR